MSSEQKIIQCHLCKEHCPQTEMASKIANGRMFATKELIACQKELEEYRAIGTPEECRAAVEKQKAKKIVRVKLRQSEWGSEYRCPVCESDLIKTVFFNEDGTEPDEKISWCSGCGQKLDWSDEK